MRCVKILKEHKPNVVCAKCGVHGVDVVLQSEKGRVPVCARCYLPYTMPNLETILGMLAEGISRKGFFGGVSQVSKMIEDMKR